MLDVSVIVPVYNTMPYLTDCLQSLVDQTLDGDAYEIIAVDDGSTDGSGDEIDRFGEQYPGLVRPVHRSNSGGPAAPCNQGLELARAKYVFFVGGDDYLGTEALERLVRVADEWETDVLLCKIAGVGGRSVETRMYRDEIKDVDLFSSRAPYAMGNTKLFRRGLIEDHGLCFPEDLPMGSDQPFTFRALLHSRRISIVNDYDYYYAVRREDSSNITFSATSRRRAEFAARMMDFVASWIEPGVKRDAILIRHFDWEISETLELDYLNSSFEDRAVIRATVKRLAADYLTDRVSDQISVAKRVRIRLAAAGRADELVQSIEDQFGARRRKPAYVTEDEKMYLDYAGFEDALPDEAYELHKRELSVAIAKRVDCGASTSGGVTRVTASVPVVARNAAAHMEVCDASGEVLAQLQLATWPQSRKTVVDVTVRRVGDLVLRLPLGGTVVELPIPTMRRQSMRARLGAAIRRQ